MTLYDRIRQLRIESGMSQDDLAHAMGYKDRSMITKIESGKVDISQKKILAFAHVLNTTPSYLMGLELESAHEPSDAPVTPEARILAKGVDSLPPEERQQLLDMARLMFKHRFDGE